jgi:hypothetical protein
MSGMSNKDCREKTAVIVTGEKSLAVTKTV